MRFDNSQLSSSRSIAPFFSPPIMSILYICVWLAALVTIALWPNRSGYHLMLGSNIPIVFLAVFVLVLIMTSYTQMRCGRGELVRNDYISRFERKEIRTIEEESGFFSYTLGVSLLHAAFFLVPVLPFLMASSTISGIPFPVFLKALGILFMAAFFCRIYGFMIYLVFGKWSAYGYFLCRAGYMVFMFATGFFPPWLNRLNPVVQIFYLYRGDAALLEAPLTPYAVFSLSMILVTGIFVLVCGAMTVRRMTEKEKA